MSFQTENFPKFKKKKRTKYRSFYLSFPHLSCAWHFSFSLHCKLDYFMHQFFNVLTCKSIIIAITLDSLTAMSQLYLLFFYFFFYSIWNFMSIKRKTHKLYKTLFLCVCVCVCVCVIVLS